VCGEMKHLPLLHLEVAALEGRKEGSGLRI
jgi:hypothetical protein